MNRVRKAVITAAGRGTRHYPATRTVQKELFPLVGPDGITKPVLQMVVEEAIQSGIERVCIVCSPESEGPIRAHFAPVTESQRASFASKPQIAAQAEALDHLASCLEFVTQPSPDGFGDAMLCARSFVGDEPFLLLLGDHVYVSSDETRCAERLMAAYHEHQQPVTGVQRTPINSLHLFGTVSGTSLPDSPDTYRITAMVEKPSPEIARAQLRTPGLPEDEYFAFFGMHVLTPHVFELMADRKAKGLREGGEFQLTSSLLEMAQEGEFYAIEVPGHRLDMGVPEGLIHTMTILALHSPYRELLLKTVAAER